MEGGREGMREGGDGGRDAGREAGREAGMVLCRERASVEEERVEGGGLMKGTSEEGTERGYGRPRERGEGGSERRMD